MSSPSAVEQQDVSGARQAAAVVRSRPRARGAPRAPRAVPSGCSSVSVTSIARVAVVWVKSRGGAGAQQLAAVDDDDVVAGALQLAEQVRGDQDRDAEVGVDAADQAEHLVAADRVEAVGRLVQEDQLRVVDQGLGELDALLHAGRVAADGAVALLVQADVAQGVRGALAGGGRRQPGHARHVDDELGGRDVGRQAVVLGHVADPLADGGALGGDVEAEHGGAALGGGGQTQQDLDQGGLAGSVGADESGHTGSDVHGEPVKRGHPGEPLAQAFGRDHSHVFDGSGADHSGRQPTELYPRQPPVVRARRGPPEVRHSAARHPHPAGCPQAAQPC